MKLLPEETRSEFYKESKYTPIFFNHSFFLIDVDLGPWLFGLGNKELVQINPGDGVTEEETCVAFVLGQVTIDKSCSADFEAAIDDEHSKLKLENHPDLLEHWGTYNQAHGDFREIYQALYEMNIGTEVFKDLYPPHPPKFYYHKRMAIELLLGFKTWKT